MRLKKGKKIRSTGELVLKGRKGQKTERKKKSERERSVMTTRELLNEDREKGKTEELPLLHDE